jgi:GNAT superfamily N-acetyltransferase
MNSAFTIRKGTPSDIETVVLHRRNMFLDMGYEENDAFRVMERNSREFFERGLSDGTYHVWFAETADGTIVAGGGVVILTYQPSMFNPTPSRPFVVNMYTAPEYRKQGLAREIMGTIMAWCKREGFTSLSLHASVHGRHLYELLGFKQTNEMRMLLR